MIKEYLKVIGIGILAGLFHWKTILFYLFVVYLFFKAWIELGFLEALIIIPIAYMLKLLGKWL